MATTTLFEDIAEAGVKEFTNNTREHNEKNLEAINDSVEETGFMRSIVIDENGETIAGNGTLETAKKRGAKILIVDVDDRNTLVAVRRSDLTQKEKVRGNLWDNRTTDLSKNKNDAIQRVSADNPGQMILDGIFSEKEQSKILRAHENAQALAVGGAADDETPELKSNAGVVKSSATRMVQLFFDVDNIATFVRRVRDLGKGLYPDSKNITETVDKIIERAHAEWLTQDKAKEAEVLSPDGDGEGAILPA